MLELDKDIEVVGEAVSGEDGITQAERLSPDIILMDIKMPDMDGIAATRQLKQKMADVKVIMLTLYDSEYVPQAIEAGASGYILKDAKGEQLIQAIRDAYKGDSPLAPSLTRQVLTELANLSRASRDSLLSERQCEILRLVAAGLTGKNIGAGLFISEPTVKKELARIFDKLGVNDRAHAVSEAMKRKLI
ncbi:Transcriptional regulatory protein DegU [subsurface metagenome]